MCAYVLVAEDDERQAEVLRRYLVAAGHEVKVVHDGRTALDQARRLQPDLLVLDVMMPLISGVDVCRAVRQESDMLVLMVTARSSEEQVLLGLDAGADDYVVKPYSPRELTARIRTLLRRAGRIPGNPSIRRVGRLCVDPDRHQASLDGIPIDCTPAQFQLLAAMSEQPDRVFTRSQLLLYTNGFDRDSTERSIDAHVMNLRRKIEPNLRRPTLLVTVYGVGYKLTGGG